MSKKMLGCLCCMVLVGLTGCGDKNARSRASLPLSKAVPVSEMVTRPGAPTEMVWVHSVDEGLDLARASNKPVLIDFGAGWCGWCKKLDREVFPDAQVVALSEKFVNVKIDTDATPAVAQKYGVRGLPTIVFLSSTGEVLNTTVGFRDAPAFARIMREVLKK